MKQRQKKVSLFDWLAADNKPDYLGFRRLDPKRVRLAMAIMRAGQCDCGHSWTEHVQTANGAFACRHFGCGCNNVVRP
jgi:hypothetical protein